MTWACELGLTVEQGKKILDRNKEIEDIAQGQKEVSLYEKQSKKMCDYLVKQVEEEEQARAFREIVEALKSEDVSQGIEAKKEVKE